MNTWSRCWFWSSYSNDCKSGSQTIVSASVADSGCLYRVLDPYFSIPDPGLRAKKILDLGFRIRIRIKEFIFLTQKLFLCSRKNDLGCSSWNPDLNPGSRGKKHWIPGPDPQHWFQLGLVKWLGWPCRRDRPRLAKFLSVGVGTEAERQEDHPSNPPHLPTSPDT